MLCDVILQLNQENIELGHHKHGFILKKIILKLMNLLLKVNINLKIYWIKNVNVI